MIERVLFLCISFLSLVHLSLQIIFLLYNTESSMWSDLHEDKLLPNLVRQHTKKDFIF